MKLQGGFLCLMLMIAEDISALTWTEIEPPAPVKDTTNNIPSLPCGIKAGLGAEEWTVEGDLTYISSEDADYGKVMAVYLDGKEGFSLICQIDLNETECDSAAVCSCTETATATETKYTITATADAFCRREYTKKNYEACDPVDLVLYILDGNKKGVFAELGQLPLIYEQATPFCSVDHQEMTSGSNSEYKIGQTGMEHIIYCCVNNLITPYEVKISINDKVLSMWYNKPCSNQFEHIKYDFEKETSYELKLEYKELGETCARTDSGGLSFALKAISSHPCHVKNPCNGTYCTVKPSDPSDFLCNCTSYMNGAAILDRHLWKKGRNCEQDHPCASDDACGENSICHLNKNQPDTHICIAFPATVPPFFISCANKNNDILAVTMTTILSMYFF